MTDEIDSLDGGNIAGSYSGSGEGASLVGALPELLEAFDALQSRAEDSGIVFEVADFGGLRTQDDTAKILRYRDNDWAAALRAKPSLANTTTKEAWRPISEWGKSMHNYGAAFDVVIRSHPEFMSSAEALRVVQGLSRSVGLVAGVNFSRSDPPHFEIPGGLSVARSRWQSLNGTTIFTRPGATLAGVLVFVVVALFIFFFFSRH